MRKIVILVVTITILPLVEAITLFGKDISMLVLIPSILILIISVIFILMVIRDKIKNKLIEPLKPEDIPKPAPIEDLTGALPIENAPKEIPKTHELKIDYTKEIAALERESPSKNIETTHKKLNELIKRFFSDYLGIDYNFTFEELEKELKKRDKKIICFSNNLSSITYSPEGISREQLTELIKEFKEVVTSTQENQPLPPEFKKAIEEKKKKIKALLKKCEKLIGKDKNQARERYKEISSLYKTLPDEDKETVRSPIINLYSKL